MKEKKEYTIKIIEKKGKSVVDDKTTFQVEDEEVFKIGIETNKLNFKFIAKLSKLLADEFTEDL